MKSTRPYTLGLIGYGHMGTAIAHGAVVNEYLERYQICVYDHHEEKTKALCQEESFAFLKDEKETASLSHIVLIAVQPQKLDACLQKLKGTRIECLLTIVAGVPTSYYQQMLGQDLPVIRAMPNMPLEIGEGATALCKSASCSADDYDFVYNLFSAMGLTRTIPEDKMSEIIAVNGSTPAYFYYFLNALLKDAVARGIDEEAARALLVQTMIGSGKMLLKNKKASIDSLIDAVCTKGGTTIEAVNAFKENNLDAIVQEADNRCIARSNQIGQSFSHS
jgi:pyrroline-5-carboxylate reductase